MIGANNIKRKQSEISSGARVVTARSRIQLQNLERIRGEVVAMRRSRLVSASRSQRDSRTSTRQCVATYCPATQFKLSVYGAFRRR